MSDFLEKHKITLDKPSLLEEGSYLLSKDSKQKYVKPVEVFVFEGPIHFARFISTNEESLSSFKQLKPIENYIIGHNRACCGDSRRNWYKIIDKFVSDLLLNKSNQELLDKIKFLLNAKKITYKGEIEINF